MVHKNFKYMAFGSSLRDLGESAVHLKPPHGGFGDEWDSNAPGVERGLAIMCTKTSIYFCFTLNFLACSQKPFLALFLIIIPLTPQIIFTMFTNFPNGNHISPKLLFLTPPNIIGYHYMTLRPRCIKIGRGCITETIILLDPPI